jgi:thiamine-monophosphate kinase
MREIGEFGLIDRLASRLKQRVGSHPSGVVIGIGDDTAVLEYQPDQQIVATTDALVEGVHFRKDTITYHNVGYKAMAASISDVAAMGGRPQHGMITMAIPADIEVETLECIYDGIAEICNEYDCAVVGGDIVKTDGPLLINVALLGTVERGKALLRSTAQVGDIVFVTGTLGGSAAGLALRCQYKGTELEQSMRDYLIGCHERPTPQVTAGTLLAESGICTSCNDISDGLASELHEIAAASNVTITIIEKHIPIHDYVRQFASLTGSDPYSWALYGGEDYQLVGTVHKQHVGAIQSKFQEHQIPFVVIGEVTGFGNKVLMAKENETIELEKSGYNHFRT